MSATEILEKIEQLPEEERRRLFEKLSQLEDVPESLRESLAEVSRGELIPLDDALQELDDAGSIVSRPRLRFAKL